MLKKTIFSFTPFSKLFSVQTSRKSRISPNLLKKLHSLKERNDQLHSELSSGRVSVQAMKDLGKEKVQISGVVEMFEEYLDTEKSMRDLQPMIQNTEEPELALIAQEELNDHLKTLQKLETDIIAYFLPEDDRSNAIIEVRPGPGGSEASLWAADLLQLYEDYTELKGWRWKVMDQHQTELGGVREAVVSITGSRVFAQLKWESGVHRVQRVPVTESSGRLHTSTATVVVLPELEQAQEITISPADLKIDTYRSGGAGGQHVNTTDSAIRITHLPTGIIVSCQNERSQHQNKAEAMKVLKARVYQHQLSNLNQGRGEMRSNQIGTGDRCERIRTYNFPQDRVTDHRLASLNYHGIDRFMTGDILDEIHLQLKESEDQKILNTIE